MSAKNGLRDRCEPAFCLLILASDWPMDIKTGLWLVGCILSSRHTLISAWGSPWGDTGESYGGQGGWGWEIGGDCDHLISRNKLTKKTTIFIKTPEKKNFYTDSLFIIWMSLNDWKYLFFIEKLWFVCEAIEDGDEEPAEPVEDVGGDVGLQREQTFINVGSELSSVKDIRCFRITSQRPLHSNESKSTCFNQL